jgi:oligopeptide transport system substrate-binding protein
VAAAPTATTATAGGGDVQNAPVPGVLRYRLASEPAELDPQKMSFVDEIGTGELVFEGLMTLDAKLNVIPAAAEKVDVSADGLKYTVTVKDGLKYSDGQPLTAKNFEYAWKRLFDPRVLNKQYSSVAYVIKGSSELDNTPMTDTAKIDQLMGELGVKATDDKHIEFTLTDKAAYFPYILALWTGWPSRQDLVEAGGDQWTTDATGKYYIGNGPFVMKEYKGDQGWTLVANQNYRQGPPKIKELRANIITDSAVAFQSYKKGELDYVAVAPEDYATAKADAVLSKELVDVAGSCNFYLGFNTQKPPFDNIKVRQAFAYAFDRQDYVTNVVKGLGSVALSFIPPDRPGFAPDIQMYQFDANKAKQTLADAGYPNGAGLPEIKLTYSSTPRNKTRMEWVQNQLKSHLGLNAALDPVESKAYTALTKDPATTPQLFYLGWCQDYPDPQDWLSLVFQSTSTVTHVGWKNADFDRLTAEADAETDATKRLDLYHQAHEILVREAPVVFIYWDATPWLIKPYVQGMKDHIIPQDHDLPGITNLMNITVGQ